ncbi:unnamed protein product [Boreogadus saida]
MTGRFYRVFAAVLKRTVYFTLRGNVANNPLRRSGDHGAQSAGTALARQRASGLWDVIRGFRPIPRDADLLMALARGGDVPGGEEEEEKEEEEEEEEEEEQRGRRSGARVEGWAVTGQTPVQEPTFLPPAARGSGAAARRSGPHTVSLVRRALQDAGHDPWHPPRDPTPRELACELHVLFARGAANDPNQASAAARRLLWGADQKERTSLGGPGPFRRDTAR